MKLLIWLLIVLTAAPALAQTPAAPPAPAPATQPPPVPVDAATIYSHLLFLEGRVESLSAQVREAHTEDLASSHQIGLQVEAVHELLVVEAQKPNPIVNMLTNRTFWELAAGLVASSIIAWQHRADKPK